MSQTYVVTERAGPRVAGRRVRPGQELVLTADEARHELREGTIVPKGTTLAPAFGADSAVLAALRERARGKEPAGAVAAGAETGRDPAVDEPAVEQLSKSARKTGKSGG